MALFIIDRDEIMPLERTTFRANGISERADLQKFLRQRIEVIAPDTLVVAEEFGDWEGSRRRIDLLGIDRSANLVVIELKRTEDGGHMDLQAIRYAAMVSTLTFQQVEGVFGHHLEQQGRDGSEARETLLDWLDWETPEESAFGQDVRIILASAEFDREITTAVLWLNERGLDIRCIRLEPYRKGGEIILDVQQVVPLPEAIEYQVRVREKERREREERRAGPDFTRYDLTIGDKVLQNQWKRRVIYHIVRHLLDHDVTPARISEIIDWRGHRLFREVPGVVDSAELIAALERISGDGGPAFDPRRYFCSDEELLHVGGKTYVLTNQWGHRSLEAVERLSTTFPEHRIAISPVKR